MPHNTGEFGVNNDSMNGSVMSVVISQGSSSETVKDRVVSVKFGAMGNGTADTNSDSRIGDKVNERADKTSEPNWYPPYCNLATGYWMTYGLLVVMNWTGIDCCMGVVGVIGADVLHMILPTILEMISCHLASCKCLGGVVVLHIGILFVAVAIEISGVQEWQLVLETWYMTPMSASFNVMALSLSFFCAMVRCTGGAMGHLVSNAVTKLAHVAVCAIGSMLTQSKKGQWAHGGHANGSEALWCGLTLEVTVAGPNCATNVMHGIFNHQTSSPATKHVFSKQADSTHQKD
ncbi:hypothetical protein F4604DRAFT_1683573 [Suillus subluteus]|nr:hypothetical protein F4604DRAFT_1683573 [Suillus subluteus]